MLDLCGLLGMVGAGREHGCALGLHNTLVLVQSMIDLRPVVDGLLARIAPEWRVEISDETPEDDAWAEIESHSHTLATLRLSKQFWTLSESRQYDILAHEIVHLLLDPIDHFVEHITERNRNKGAVRDHYNQIRETAVDRIVEALRR